MKPEQLTAWALNELSDEEKAQIESLLKDDGDVQTQAAQTKTFCDFLTTELSQDSLALTPEQRERLWSADEPSASQPKQISQPSIPAVKKTTFWRRHALVNLAAAAAVVLGSTVLLRHEAEETALREDIMATRSQAVGKDESMLDDKARPQVAPKPQAEAAAMPAPLPPEVLLQEGKSKLETGDFDGAMLSYGKALRADPYNSAARTGAERVQQKRDEYLINAADQQRSRMLNTVNEAWEHKPSSQAAAAPPPPAAPNNPMIAGKDMAQPDSSPVPRQSGGNLILQGGASEENSIESKRNAPAVGGLAAGSAVRAAPMDAIVAAKNLKPADGRVYRSTDELDFDSNRQDVTNLPTSESYTQIIENVLKDVMREPLSTFSIDVDTAAYANVRRFLNQNSAPPRDAVRIEELINYFPTDEEGPAPEAKEPFAVKVEMAACPWQPQHRLARIAIKGRQIGQDRQPSNLVFLVDVSGSMGAPNKLPLVQQSLRMLTEQLGENDRVSMVTYAGGTQVVLPSTTGHNKAEIMAAIDRLQSGGSTHGSAGIRLAYEQAVAGFIKGGVNRVILCSDGDFNVGISSPEELETYITEKARSGVFLTLLGYGSGNLKDRTMETLADKGNGNYAYIDSLSEARKVLVEQMNGTLVTIAKDVKIQVEFNPAVIRSYRLIGYENRLLAKEDFNDDTKDAGEIGAGHNVTALYELVPANLPPGADPRPMVDDLKYQQPTNPSAPPAVTAAAAESGEALTVKLRYKEPEGSVSRLIEVPLRQDDRSLDTASREFKFTTAVAGFGLLLRQSSYSGQLTWEQVRQLALEGKGTDPLGYRGEFIQLIEKARGLTR
jgi:secreted protein with Ig-like and vWFA domain